MFLLVEYIISTQVLGFLALSVYFRALNRQVGLISPAYFAITPLINRFSIFSKICCMMHTTP